MDNKTFHEIIIFFFDGFTFFKVRLGTWKGVKLLQNNLQNLTFGEHSNQRLDIWIFFLLSHLGHKFVFVVLVHLLINAWSILVSAMISVKLLDGSVVQVDTNGFKKMKCEVPVEGAVSHQVSLQNGWRTQPYRGKLNGNVNDEFDMEECYARATVAGTRAQSLTLIVSPLDMRGMIGVMQVLAGRAHTVGYKCRWWGRCEKGVEEQALELSAFPWWVVSHKPQDQFLSQLQEGTVCCGFATRLSFNLLRRTLVEGGHVKDNEDYKVLFNDTVLGLSNYSVQEGAKALP